jgi:transglutaminase-like putative cysteine protease
MTTVFTNAQTLQVRHTTSYSYAERVSLSYHQAMLKPRDTPLQQVENSFLRIEPLARYVLDRPDYFGNRVSVFEIDSGHAALEVVAESRVLLERSEVPALSASLPLEEITQSLRAPRDNALLAAAEYLAESPLVPRSPRLADFARPHFPPGRPYLEGVRDLMYQIFRQFRYDPKVTRISTPVSEVLKLKHGVCQDFAHVMIASLRSLGGPARYVSGYLVPLPGVVGAQASHAWVSAYCPHVGWVDFDPTNNVVPIGGHITLAWGRDFSDVSPLRGVIFGGGEHVVNVKVEVSD